VNEPFTVGAGDLNQQYDGTTITTMPGTMLFEDGTQVVVTDVYANRRTWVVTSPRCADPGPYNRKERRRAAALSRRKSK